MEGGAFCVVCGRSDRALTDGLCAECYAKRHALVETDPNPVVILCPTCGARKVGQHWERRGAPTLLSADDLTPFLRPHPEVGIRRVDWTDSGQNPLLREIEGELEVRFRGIERTTVVRFQARIRHETCQECSRKSGHYYTAILQLRGPAEPTRESAQELRARLAKEWDAMLPLAKADWRRSLSWREELPEGWDLYLTDTLAARSLARIAKDRLRATVKESPTLYGRKDGHDVYRVTFCVRIPAREEGARVDSTAVRPKHRRQRSPVER